VIDAKMKALLKDILRREILEEFNSKEIKGNAKKQLANN